MFGLRSNVDPNVSASEASPSVRRLPKFFLMLPGYRRPDLVADIIAGITVGLVALPMAMAFAISSGVPPQAGLYCAIIAGFITSFLGGSRTQVSGPTGAFVVVVAGIVSKFGINGLFVCTLMAGGILVVLGLTGLGAAVKYIPRPVIVGFTNGIAILIASTQIKDFLGLQINHLPADFLGRILALYHGLPTVMWVTAIFASVCLVTLIGFRTYLPRVPAAVVVMIVGTAIAYTFKLPLETIQTRFGGIPQGLPSFKMPSIPEGGISVLLPSALTIVMLGAIESLLSAVVADRMTRDKHDPNVELTAQGIANVISPLFGGLPSTGAIARTATNIRAGARSPVAGMIHALVLLMILLVAAPLADQIPLSMLAAILLMVAYNMGEWREIGQILKLTRADISVWAVTFGLTVFADLSVAVEVGMILAALLYISRVTRTTTVSRITEGDLEEGREHVLQFHELPIGVAIYRVHGPFLFGSTDKVEDVVEDLPLLPPVVILRLRNMTAIDATGLQALEELYRHVQESGRELLFCGMREQPLNLMQQSGFIEHVGLENVCTSVHAALQRSREILDRPA